ncbi:hypothetical protein EDB19DRAFT_1659023 [Suillus lakei]|nr:hypothetical protein EDB19DRAFT_1659023 [Suillus lakei]
MRMVVTVLFTMLPLIFSQIDFHLGNKFSGCTTQALPKGCADSTLYIGPFPVAFTFVHILHFFQQQLSSLLMLHHVPSPKISSWVA